jgi:uncharacterized RDD family membrane protein YckC
MTTPDDPFQPPQEGQPPPVPYNPPGYGYGYGPPPPPGPYATWGERFLALLYDSLIIGVPGVVLIVIGVAIGGGGGTAIIVLAYLGIAGFSLWNRVFLQGHTGQTLGKKRLGIKLIRENTHEVLGPGYCFVRDLAHVLDSLVCDIGYLWPLWDAKKQTFADKVCHTIEVKVF